VTAESGMFLKPGQVLLRGEPGSCRGEGVFIFRYEKVLSKRPWPRARENGPQAVGGPVPTGDRKGKGAQHRSGPKDPVRPDHVVQFGPAT